MSININGNKLDYSSIINNSETVVINIPSKTKTYSFELNYIEWKTDIGDKYYYYYFLDNKYCERGKKTTQLNNNGIGFKHSLYVVSDYFEDFFPLPETEINQETGPNDQVALFEKDEVFKSLMKESFEFLLRKRKQFIQRNSEVLIAKLDEEGVMPEFTTTKYDQERKQDLVKVTTSIFKIEPRLFVGVDPLQKKSFLSLLNLLLDTDERNNILKIVDGLVNDLSPEDRKELAELLKITTFTRVVRTLKQITQRFQNIQILKTLIFELSKFTGEREHLQKIMENSFWLFGEQYTLVAADVTFQKALERYYIEILNKDTNAKQQEANSSEIRRPDIFLARQNPVSLTPQTLLEENVIVELKRPSVTIGMKEFRQVQDYLDYIMNKPEFNGDLRRWKFFLVGRELDIEIVNRIRARQSEGKENFLVETVGNYSIYAMKWDDLFISFSMRNGYILKSLNYDEDAVKEALKADGITPDMLPNFLTNKVVVSGM